MVLEHVKIFTTSIIGCVSVCVPWETEVQSSTNSERARTRTTRRDLDSNNFCKRWTMSPPETTTIQLWPTCAHCSITLHHDVNIRGQSQLSHFSKAVGRKFWACSLCIVRLLMLSLVPSRPVREREKGPGTQGLRMRVSLIHEFTEQSRE